jgi:hypothetical protein
MSLSWTDLGGVLIDSAVGDFDLDGRVACVPDYSKLGHSALFAAPVATLFTRVNACALWRTSDVTSF